MPGIFFVKSIYRTKNNLQLSAIDADLFQTFHQIHSIKVNLKLIFGSQRISTTLGLVFIACKE